jgi:hypothetical protein
MNTQTLRKIGVGSALVTSLLTGCKEDISLMDLNVGDLGRVTQISYRDFPTSTPFPNDGIFKTDDGFYIIRDSPLLYVVNREGRLLNVLGSHRVDRKDNGLFRFYGGPTWDNTESKNEWLNEVFESAKGRVYVRGWRN